MKEKTIVVECECSRCDGTGLYQGMCEKDGAAVVCHYCAGSGKSSIQYTPFTGRKESKNINRVFGETAGYVHGVTDIIIDGVKIAFSRGGCTYEEWKAGMQPKPIKELYCPYQWSAQSLQHEDHKAYKLYKEQCNKVLRVSSFISECKNRCNMAQCWKRYEELGGK
jgi:hypothetical protein